ncbi:MAG: GNAT family N-acetyltransferase [Candidatus Rokuibacteriota bacterium]|nr:MAG: GNAT family N-acetyltransferase [Candidatus Rokubacteria bacterium]
MAARLEGRLVVVEPLTAEHEAGLYEAACEMDWTWMPVDASASQEVFRAWLEDALARGEAGLDIPFATVDAATGEPLGSTRYLNLRPEHRGLEIGWTWLRRSAWGGGANVEAKLLMLTHAFDQLGCMRVEFKTDARNERSRRALEALPARFEGIFVKHMLVQRDEVRDSAWYAITNDEWPAVRSSLEQRLRART